MIADIILLLAGIAVAVVATLLAGRNKNKKLSLVKVLSQCPNVTVMGLTPSNCSCQETGGISYLSNSICNVYYPVNWLYELDDNVRYIDTDQTRECTLPLDVKIPFTYELVRSLYDNFETRDIILEYAVDYLAKNTY